MEINMADNIKQNQPELDLGEQQRIRQEKLKALQEEGKDPFVITKYDQTHHSADIKENFDELEGKVVRVAGRMMSKRVMGKASFCNLQDLKGNIQSYVARDSIGEESYADFKKAKAAGLKHLTHFCNQMSPQHHREIGLVGSGMLDKDIKIEIICDKIHLSPDMLNLTFSNKDISQMIMITDSLACSWMPDGPGQLGGLPIIVKDGVARLEAGNLAGSTLRFAKGLKNVQEITGMPLSEIVKATSWNQAQSLGLHDLGKIAPGYTADLVLLDAEYDVVKTIIDGEVRYEA